MDNLKKIIAIFLLVILFILFLGLIISTILGKSQYIMPILFTIIFISILVYIFIIFAKNQKK